MKALRERVFVVLSPPCDRTARRHRVELIFLWCRSAAHRFSV